MYKERFNHIIQAKQHYITVIPQQFELFKKGFNQNHIPEEISFISDDKSEQDIDNRNKSFYCNIKINDNYFRSKTAPIYNKIVEWKD